MDLEIREALALSTDRTAALAHLLPGSEDHDYYRCLHAQHTGRLDEADAILEAWPRRHGQTPWYHRLRLRQLLWRVTKEPAVAADQVRDWFGVAHWHEAEVEEVDPSRPTKLAAGSFDGERLLAQAVQHDSNLGQVTDDGLYELLSRTLDPVRRRVLLGRLQHTPQPELVARIAEDLALKDSGGFGSLGIHAQLTLAQLHELARLRPELRGQHAWVHAVVARMVPSASVIDLELDRDARHAYLEALWAFVAELPPVINSLKAHVLWHLLDSTRRLGRPVDPKLFAAYLQLPRAATYVSRRWMEKLDRESVAQLGQDFQGVTRLRAAGNDELLVRALLHERIDIAEQFAPWLDRAWLDREIAIATLLYGDRDVDRATQTLGPVAAAALRDRIDLEWSVHNPTRFRGDAPIALDVDVKHVPELVVKVFRVDPLAYFQHHKREISTDLDLDGLAASHEEVLRFPEPPIRRVRRRLELPMCTRAGTYVIDLIGNGMSSRAIVHKGRLRRMMRVGAPGHIVTIVDEDGRPRPDARAWLGDREYLPDEHGAFVVPFSTAPGQHPVLLSCGDITSVETLTLYRETYALSMTVHLDRETLTAGRTARAIARVRLDVSGAPVSLAAVKDPMWDVILTDAHGVSTTKSQPLVLGDSDATVLEWPMGDDTSQVTIAVRGAVEVLSEQRTQEVSDARTFQVGTINRTSSIEALFLAHTAGGWVVSALGKSGEPRAQRPVTVSLTHRWSRMILKFELATDERGRVELGALPGVSQITATLGGTTQQWWAEDRVGEIGVHIPTGSDFILPIAPMRSPDEVLRRLSIVETNGQPVRHPDVTLEPLASGIAIRGLPTGEYTLRAPGVPRTTIGVLDVISQLGVIGFTRSEVAQLTPPSPAVETIDTHEGLRIVLRGATSRTRVHVIAKRFMPAPIELPWLGPARGVSRRTDRARMTLYVSGRELGDEYRYILERRTAKRFPNLLLDRPGLLLNPWSRRTTSTDVAQARPGGAFAPAPAAGYADRARGGEARGRAATDEAAFTSYDFLGAPPVVLANLVPDAHGVIVLSAADLGDASFATVIVDDPDGTILRHVPLAERPLAPRDLRLQLALDPQRHATQKKQIAPLRAGEQLVIEDLATAKLHLVDTVAKAHAYLLALSEEATLREFAFVTRWQEVPDGERRELYSKYACHELHLFLYHRDRAFFDAVVKPYLAHKRVKTFIDHWLLETDLAHYLEPAAFLRLNAIERALLARRLVADDALPRLLADEVTIQPPDPARDTRLIDSLLGAEMLHGDQTITAAKEEAYADAMTRAPMAAMASPMMMAPGSPPPPPRAAPKAAKKMAARAADYDDNDADEPEASSPLVADFKMRQDQAPPLFRAADKTQEWAEHNWWHRTPAQSGPEMVTANRLWRDLAQHRSGPFLSPGLGLATGSFAEAMCALAVTDLPFVAGAHVITPAGPRLTITAASTTLVGSSQLVDGELVTSGAPLVVGMSYVRDDDRHDWVNGEQVDKYIDGAFATGVVYTCLVVLANPSSTRQRIQGLIQIPRGSIAVGGARTTDTIDVVLDPYATHGHEVSFYFPVAGRWSHFPVHVSRDGVIVAAAPGRTLEVTTGGQIVDPRSWSHLSQRGSLADVVAYLGTANLAATDLERVAWRLADPAAYQAIIGVLERRHGFSPTVWGYALRHLDAPRIQRFLRTLGDRLLAAGPVLEMLQLDAEDVGAYEHLEYAPLINARAHRLGPKLRILNDGLAAQYDRFLELVAHRSEPTAEDLLAAASYLLAQDRVEPALVMLERVRPGEIADRMQYAYLAAYAACLTGDVVRARELVSPWRDHPVDRWRHRFGALAAMLDEVAGAAPAVVDPRSREQQHGELAAKQPTFELAVDREGIVIRSQHVAALELRFFEMDVELLFSRQPFVQSDIARFSFIEPGHREHLTQLPGELRIPWPAQLRGKNVVVEAVGAGQRKAKVHYANDLAPTLSNHVGQIRVSRASDQAPLPATYVKVYARKRGGAVSFYKDGYTDMRGWFDYASLSTTDLDSVERFAILVCSDQAGAAILEASPPTR